MRTHTYRHAHAFQSRRSPGPTTGLPHLRPSRSPHLRPRRPYVHLLLPFCHPLFIRSSDTREETWPHASSHGPNNGGYTGPCPLFACSCFDEVRLQPHNATTFFRIPSSSFSSFFFSFSFPRFFSLPFSLLARYLLPSVSKFRCLIFCERQVF